MVKKYFYTFFFLIFIPISLFSGSKIKVIPVKTTINPIITEFLEKRFEDFKKDGTSAVILLLDTPGGSLESTRGIIQQMLNAPFIVVTYIYPRGARGASAGFFILMASDIAAMAPTTHTGAATPVTLGGDKKMSGAMKRKVMEDTTAFLRNLVKRKKRSMKFALQTVTRARSYTSKEALALKLIDIEAPTLDHVIHYLEEKRIFTKNNTKVVIENAEITEITIPWHKRLLLFLANPSVIYILLTLGMLGIIFEFYTPGIGFPGIFGFICLMFAFAGLSLIPVSYVGVLFIILGVVLLILELHIVSYGLLTIGGVFLLGLGSFMFFDKYPASFSFFRGILIGFVVVAVFLVFLVLSKLIKMRKTETGFFIHKNKIGIVIENFQNYKGMVFVNGEYWEAKSGLNLKKGNHVRIMDQEGMKLIVEKEG